MHLIRFLILLLLTAVFFAPARGTTPLTNEPSTAVTNAVPPDVIAPARMCLWRYVVIHHSGSSSGNAAIIEAEHLRRGMENGMAYHFLIGNGTAGLGDGVVVEGRRWKDQLPGGHAHQDYLNEHGIGVCLIGNFNRNGPTAKQIGALAVLLLRFQAEFGIFDENIHGHGQYYGEDSDCPGKLFPWTKLWASLNEGYQIQLASNENRNPPPVTKP